MAAIVIRKRRFNRRRRPLRPRMRVRRPIGSRYNSLKQYNFKRMAVPISMFNDATGTTGYINTDSPLGFFNLSATGVTQGDIRNMSGGTSFQLADIEGYGDFQNLYDQYMLAGVGIKIWWNSTSADSTTRIPAPRITYVPDYDDNAYPTYSALRQKQGVRTHQFANGRPLSIYLKPKFASQVYEGITNTG